MNFVWSVLSGISSLFSREKPPEFSDADYSELLTEKSEEKIEEPEELVRPVCQHRTGTITNLQADYGMIDKHFYFELTELNQKNVKVGDVVKYMAYRTDINAAWKVKNVTLPEKDEWEQGYETPGTPSLITSENFIVSKKLVLKISEKKGRIIILENDVTCNLDEVQADFLPMEGDMVVLDALVEVNVNDKNVNNDKNVVEIQRIKALRSQNYSGNITHLGNDASYDFMGIINSEVYFNSNVCEPSYEPKIDDMVVAHVIESYQGTLSWRAINVIPVTSDPPEFSLGMEEERLFDSKNGISLTTHCAKKNLKIGEETNYQIDVENEGSETQYLVESNLRNFKTSGVMKIITSLTEPIAISPSSSFSLHVQVKPDCIGYFTDVLVLRFQGNWDIGCMLEIYVDLDQSLKEKIKPPSRNSSQALKSKYKHYERRNAAAKKLEPTNIGFIVPGVRPIKPASFIPNRLDLYAVPKNITNIIINRDGFRKSKEIQDEIVKLYSCMEEELNEKNYLLKFHNLLHIEDQELSIAIKKYDQERICFDRHVDFLTIKIPNLAESRPSLVIGDKLIASDPAVFHSNGTKYEAYIHKVLSNSIYVKFNDAFQSAYNGKDYSITFVHSRTGVRRCHQALNLVFQHLGSAWLFPDTLNLKRSFVKIKRECPPLEKRKDDEHVCAQKIENSNRKGNTISILDLMNSDDIVNGRSQEDSIKTAEKDKVYKSIKKEFMSSNPDGVLRWINPKLNFYQKEAVRNILKGVARPLPYVIFGPPGTGKTVTVVEAILQIVCQIPHSRILVATPSNSSADLICSRLLSWDLLSPGDLVRIVGYNYMLDDRMPALVKPYCTVVDLKNAEGSYEEDGIKYSSKQVVGRHRITVGTCVSLGILYTMGFPRGHFTHVIVDEAGQSIEPEILIPLAFLNNDSQAILAGDPRQLGPVVTSKCAETLGLGESLLDRFLMRFPYHRDPESYPDTNGYDPRLVTWLLYNYRSLPEILNLYSTLFYESKLLPKVCGKCSEETKILENIARKLTTIRRTSGGTAPAVIFHGVRGINMQDDDSPSWYNNHEIVKVLEYLQDFYSCSLKSSDVGIITPYQKQVHKIREMIRGYDLDVPKVGSVEEFQGQERKVIILSTVRSEEGLLEKDKMFSLGFVASKQRVNVAVSRARCLLIIIGNPHLLVKDIAWRNLLKMCLELKTYVGCDLPAVLTR